MIYQSCLGNEASAKTQKDGVQRASGGGEQVEVPGELPPEEGMEALCFFSYPMCLFHLAVPGLYPLTINQWSSK